MGTVWIFNTSYNNVILSINNPSRADASIRGITARPYNPLGVQIQRSDVAPPSGAAFINGQTNTVAIKIVIGSNQTVSTTASLDIPAASASTVDLWLYLFFNVAVLFDTGGKTLDEVALNWGDTGVLLSPEPSMAMETELAEEDWGE